MPNRASKFAMGGKKLLKNRHFNPKFNEVFKGVRDVWDNSVVAAYRTKGLRAWHDHLSLRLQKNIYFTCIVISLIFLVNESQAVASDPGTMDFFFIFTPMLWACGIDAVTVVCNCVFLCTRFIHETTLEEFKEPKMIERVCLYVIPIPIVLCTALIAYSVPRCILSNKHLDSNYCKSFSYSVLKTILIITLVVELIYSIYGLYHVWRHTSVLKPKGKQANASTNGEYTSLVNDSGESGDEIEEFSQQKSKMTTTKPSLSTSRPQMRSHW